MFLRSALVLGVVVLLSSTSALSQGEPRTTVGGYGELHYNEPDGSRRGMLDFHRFVLYFGHSFNDKLSFHSELELEHTKLEAGSSEGGEIAIEQAFLDYSIHRSFGVRAGIMLPPVGIINLYHEPPTFHGVERPSVDRVIIPSTWRESGAGVYGNITDEFKYQAYVMAGLMAEGFNASNGVRGGRQKAFESNPANPSFTGRLDYAPVLGLQLGASFFVGGSAADEDSIGTANVAMWSADARYTLDNLQLRAVGAIATIGDADKINAQFGKNVADRIFGYYIEGAYNFLPFICSESEQELFAFARYEKYNTQAATTGFTALKQYDRNDVLVGLTYKPTYNTAFKFDYTFMNNELNSGSFKNTRQLNLGIGYYFF
ncbi:MAG: hypothetical protein HW412_90 [Bacteroidetes bacterium]|nr:hypothetical protein [Bacteroidota bacterium]